MHPSINNFFFIFLTISLALLFQIKCQFTFITVIIYKTAVLPNGLRQYPPGFSITNNTSIFAPLNNK